MSLGKMINRTFLFCIGLMLIILIMFYYIGQQSATITKQQGLLASQKVMLSEQQALITKQNEEIKILNTAHVKMAKTLDDLNKKILKLQRIVGSPNGDF
jgi:uncharacterized membrane protein YgaE (UPF0421/DUF939 family)